MTAAPGFLNRRNLWLILAGVVAALGGGYVARENLAPSILKLPICKTYTSSALAGTIATHRTPSMPREQPDSDIQVAFDLVFPARVPERAVFVLRAAHNRTGDHFLLYDGPLVERIEARMPVFVRHAAEFRFSAHLIVEDEKMICDWRDRPIHVLAPDGPGSWRLQFLSEIEQGADGLQRAIGVIPVR